VRISAGNAKGRRVGFRKAFSQSGETDELRPTSAKVREAFFDIMRSHIGGSVFLDLYAGTGGMGIEALSRGVASAVLVESNVLRVRMINQLLSQFGFEGKAKAVCGRAIDFADKEAERGSRYDIIFLDPPYNSDELMKILPLIGEGEIVREGGLVVAEHFFKTKLHGDIGRLRLVKDYRYGDTVLTVYKLS